MLRGFSIGLGWQEKRRKGKREKRKREKGEWVKRLVGEKVKGFKGLLESGNLWRRFFIINYC
jgi:hypothetical protein